MRACFVAFSTDPGEIVRKSIIERYKIMLLIIAATFA